VSRRPSGLGRGLDALIPRQASTAPTRVAIERLKPNPKQPRRSFEKEALKELAASIREKGLLQPVVVRPSGDNYEIVAGERRWRAAKTAGLTEVPVVVKELDDREALELAIIENLQREDLNAMEEARAYANLTGYGMTQEDAAKAVGKARSTVANSLRLLTLPQDAQAALEKAEITAGHARAILALPEKHRAKALKLIIEKGLSVREAEALKELLADADPKGPREVPARPRYHQQLELELSRFASTKVRVVGNDKGRIELHYGSNEELNRLLELLGYQP
jgi:ParB family chromosome partitioning protein